MKKVVYALVFLACAMQLSAQEPVNLNPDPNGEPWYAVKLRTLTDDDKAKIAATPRLKMPRYYNKATLPAVVDNSTNKYFRPVFNQQNGSCGQASGVGYNFTYAIDFARDLSANTLQTQYPTHYTYNFLNNGTDVGSWYFDGWEIINANGCPDVSTYGGTPWAKGLTGWMSGYQNYLKGMGNRTLEVFTIDVTTPEGLETLKGWMNDQLNGSTVGGLANFSAGVSGSFSKTILAAGTPEQYKAVVTYWDSEINHAMTFTGYNDNVRYDFNGDGQYTNNIDINSDGVTDMRDWEIGALIMVNSWGTGWGDAGKAYVPYRLLAEPSTNGGIGTPLVHVIRAKAVYSPKVTVKASITYTSRSSLRITAGISSDPSADRPERILQLPLFNFQGGDLYMQGGDLQEDKTIEIGLDITPLLSEVESGATAKLFLVIEEKDPKDKLVGRVNSFSVIDYTNGASETVCSQVSVPLNNNDTTFLSVTKAVVFDKVTIAAANPPEIIAGIPYSYTFEAGNGTPPYSWDLSIDYGQSGGNAVFIPLTNNRVTPAGNDDSFSEISLPFEFPFYGSSYRKLLVTTDGSLLFGGNFEYVRDLSALLSQKAVTVYGADLMLYPEEGDGIWYYASADSVTVRWKTSKYDYQIFNADFCATLFPDGRIRFIYGDGITTATDWVAGISNGDRVSYSVASLSGRAQVGAGSSVLFTPAGFPEGLTIDNNGTISLLTKEAGKSWPVKIVVTDLNKISSAKSFVLSSVESLSFSDDTIKILSISDPDPWLTGKDLVVTNACDQAIELSSIDQEGRGWTVSSVPLTYPYTLQPAESVTLNIKLKSTLSKSTAITIDTMVISTDFVSYLLPVVIDPSLYSSSVYPVTFSVIDKTGPAAGAVISVESVSSPLSSGSDGKATVSLPDGSYVFSISLNGHFPVTGDFTVSGAAQLVEQYLITLGTETEDETRIEIYPNPFADVIQVKGMQGKTRITILSMSGVPLITRETTEPAAEMSAENLKPGVYMIVVEGSDGHSVSRKMIKR